MRVGIAIEETWAFLNEIHTHLSEHHEVSLFKRRVIDPPFFKERSNRYLFRRDLSSFMRRNDVVFFEWASELLVAATALPKTCGIVTRLHRYELYQWAELIQWDHVDRVILVSDAKQREFSTRFPGHASKVVVIPEAVSLSRFQPKRREFAGDIGILCHLTPRKRVYELILAFSELLRERGGFHLHIGGGPHVLHGDYYVALRGLVHSLCLDDRVTFYGNVTTPDQWHDKIDIFVSNSYSEGLQVSPMEAIASGCYCLSHRWEGADELLPEENLYYSDRELLQRILEYADLPDGAKEERKAALQARVRERFDVDKTKVLVRQTIEAAAG